MKIKILLFMSLCMAGCTPLFYVSNTQNVPAIKEKGQVNLSIGVNSTNDTSGFELQGAVGLSDKLALQINTDWVSGSGDSNTASKANLIELGLGYYKNISKSFVFETYGLIGLGGLRFEDHYSHADVTEYSSIKASLYRIGIQPDISFVSKNFIASLSTRFSNVNYYDIYGNNTSGYSDNGADMAYLKANSSQWLAEPALTLQTGFKNVKFQLQYVHSFNLGDKFFYEYYQDPYMISLGLKAQIPPKKKPNN